MGGMLLIVFGGSQPLTVICSLGAGPPGPRIAAGAFFGAGALIADGGCNVTGREFLFTRRGLRRER